jgi:hypothetical protein
MAGNDSIAAIESHQAIGSKGSIATIRHFQKLSFATGVNVPESMADN